MPPCESVSMYLQFISAGVTGFDDFDHQSVQRHSAASLCSCWVHLGSSQNLEGGIRASSSLPIGCQVSSDVCCLYEVQRERARGDHLCKGK